jgi:fucose-1-phosphate guanylyltransferase
VLAGDAAQAAGFAQAIGEKLARCELPRAAGFVVVADPAGVKAGCGGALLHALAALAEHVPDGVVRGSVAVVAPPRQPPCGPHDQQQQQRRKRQLPTWYSSARTLVLPAGGYAQRMPSASVLGKAFAAVPVRATDTGMAIMDVLDLKCAIFVDLPALIAPGSMFLCAADSFEVFSLGDLDKDQVRACRGFTALAHPSSLTVGTTHGVFVLPSGAVKPALSAQLLPCERFLHKPSLSVMRAEGAVISASAGTEERVFTDSAFWFDAEVAERLLDLYTELEPISCEIDAYGDFLQALGRSRTPDYTGSAANVVVATSSLASVRRLVYDRLSTTDMNVLVLQPSGFHHFGTMGEYLELFTADAAFAYNAATRPSVFSHVSTDAVGIEGAVTMMAATVASGAVIRRGSVLEYARIGADAIVGEECILSVVEIPSGAHVPARTFLHTCIVDLPQVGTCYATIVMATSALLGKRGRG